MPAFDVPLSALGVPPPLDRDEVIADWNCPVCGTYTPRTYRPGRPSVYCTNACRQRAYRDRRNRGIRLLYNDGQPTHRAAGARVTHLTRPVSDPVARQRASNHRCVSLCGAFVRPATDFAHLDPGFAFDDAGACWRCLDLTGAGVPDVPLIYPWQIRNRDYAGPPVVPFAARMGHMAELRGKPPRWRRITRHGSQTGNDTGPSGPYGLADGPKDPRFRSTQRTST